MRTAVLLSTLSAAAALQMHTMRGAWRSVSERTLGHAIDVDVLELSSASPLEDSRTHSALPLEAAAGAAAAADSSVLCIHRFKLWWLRPCHVDSPRQAPPETQLLLRRAGGDFELWMPVQHAGVAATLMGSGDDAAAPDVRVVLDTGSAQQPLGQLSRHDAVVRAKGSDAFDLLRRAVRFALVLGQAPAEAESELMAAADSGGPVAEDYWSSASTRQPTLTGLGWCTWDYAYTYITAERVLTGVRRLHESGIRPKFVIVDDGWQDTGPDVASGAADEMPAPSDVEIREQLEPPYLHYPRRLRSQRVGPSFGARAALSDAVSELKSVLRVETVLCWHAIFGYWAGVEPSGAFGRSVDAQLSMPYFSEELLHHEPQLATDVALTSNGGIGAPERSGGALLDFYRGLHGELKAMGVDGVKVDVQSSAATLGPEMASRVHEALRSSVLEHFAGERGSGIILHCMSHAPQVLSAIAHRWKLAAQGDPDSGTSCGGALLRGSDDFYPTQVDSHARHVYANAYNSLLLGSVGRVDWDMFQSVLPDASGRNRYAWLHAAARAVSGGPVYVSDRPGAHDPDVIAALALPDGTTTPAMGGALPCEDSLLSPDGLLGVWNVNPQRGNAVLGVFNIAEDGGARRGAVSPAMVHAYKALHADSGEAAVFAALPRSSGSLKFMRLGEEVPVDLPPAAFEVVTFAPVGAVGAAVLGFADMLNAGGGVLRVSETPAGEGGGGVVTAEVIAAGTLVVAAVERPPSRVQDAAGHELDFAVSETAEGAGFDVRIGLGRGGERVTVRLVF